MRIRMEFIRDKGLRFVSHLDLLKTMERSLRRAEVPLAFSEGFNPHPKISFASALAVGLTSSGEYMDIETNQEVDPQKLVSDLNNNLPTGLKITRAVTVDKSLPALMAVVNRAIYQVKVGLKEPVATDKLKDAIDKLKEQDEILITRNTKKGPREKNIRSGIVQIKGRAENKEIFLEMLLFAGEANVRPEEVVQALVKYGQIGAVDYLELHRQGLFLAQGEGIVTPIEGTVLL